MIFVSLPYWKTPHLLRRAVDSILAQTHRDLLLVVVNDGDTPPWERLADIRDSRLVSFDLPENRGRYYCDAVTLAANPFDLYTIHDSDDWSESTRLAYLVECLGGMEGAADGYLRHGLNGEVTKQKPRPELMGHRATRSLWHIAHHKGLWRTESLQTIGIHPGFRVGWDTYLMQFAALSLKMNWISYYGYHQERRKGSLITSTGTGVQSRLRAKAIEAFEELWKQAQVFPDQVTQICAPPPDLALRVEADAERLRKLL